MHDLAVCIPDREDVVHLDEALAAELEEEARAKIVDVAGERSVRLPALADRIRPLHGRLETSEVAVAVEGVRELEELRRGGVWQVMLTSVGSSSNDPQGPETPSRLSDRAR